MRLIFLKSLNQFFPLFTIFHIIYTSMWISPIENIPWHCPCHEHCNCHWQIVFSFCQVYIFYIARLLQGLGVMSSVTLWSHQDRAPGLMARLAQPAPDTFIIPQIHKHNKHYTAPGPGLMTHGRHITGSLLNLSSILSVSVLATLSRRESSWPRSCVSLFVIQHLLSVWIVSCRVKSELKLQPEIF